MQNHTRPDRAIRKEADVLELSAGRGRFRRRRQLDQSAATERLVLRAVERAKAGDADALRFLYLRYADNVYGYVCSILRDEHDAEDVTQQVFAKLLGSLCRYEPRTVPFSSWIMRVAHNAAIDHMRTRRPVPVDEVRGPEPADDGSARENLRALCVALRTLPKEQREVIVLRFLVGLSPGEIAERMGRSEDAVNGLQHRGRRRLRREMDRIAA
ncbi:MAG TPA: RNA polymerase sigma factor [Solirubrobacteraceae bacterium]|nr:RNA polymerase sigma factor [Solirubrobacteraceae bacterium]